MIRLFKYFSFTMLLVMVSLSASAYDVVVNGIYYNVSDSDLSCSVVAGDEQYSGSIVIPSTIVYNWQTYHVTSIGSSAFEDCQALTSVSIPNSVTSIGGKAFYGCYNLTSINIPNEVTDIGDLAFYSCKFTSINIPNKVKKIGDWAFANCENVASISIGNSVTSIGAYAFYACFNITSVNIPNSVTSIGYGAFSDCRNLTSINIPNGITSINDYTFDRCKKLTSVNIPNGVTSIGSYAFSDCHSLTSIYLPNSVIIIGQGAFVSCDSLSSVNIPNSVTSIGEAAFSGCESLYSVDIPNSVTTIGKGAFESCYLGFVSIGNGVTSIGAYAFNCSDFMKIGNNCAMEYFLQYHTAKDGIISVYDAVQTLIIAKDYSDIQISTKNYDSSSDRYGLFSKSVLKTIISKTKEPVALDASGISEYQYKTIEVIVPTESLSKYQAAPVWKDFLNLKCGAENEWSSTDINKITMDKGNKPDVIYDLQGRKLPKPQCGLNIINGKKVLVK